MQLCVATIIVLTSRIAQRLYIDLPRLSQTYIAKLDSPAQQGSATFIDLVNIGVSEV